jgi:AraC-like DNA-binding protein
MAGDIAVVDTTPSSQAAYLPAGHLAEADPFLLEAERAVRHARGRRVGAQDLARQLSMSERTLHRRLQALTGESPKQFIDRVRFEMARTLLESGAAESSRRPRRPASGRIGFRRSFKRFSGTTPGRYRDREVPGANPARADRGSGQLAQRSQLLRRSDVAPKTVVAFAVKQVPAHRALVRRQQLETRRVLVRDEFGR